MNDLVKIHSYYIYSLAAFTKVGSTPGDGMDGSIDVTDLKMAENCTIRAWHVNLQVFSDIWAVGTSHRGAYQSSRHAMIEEFERRPLPKFFSAVMI